MARLTQTQPSSVALVVRVGRLTDMSRIIRVANMGKVARMAKVDG